MGPRDPYDRKVESPHLLLRVFGSEDPPYSNPDRESNFILTSLLLTFHSLNVKRVKKTSECQFTRKRVKATQKKLLSTRKREKREKKVRFFTRKRVKKEWKWTRVNTTQKCIVSPFKSLKSGHSLAESELHSFSEWIVSRTSKIVEYSLEKEWRSLSASECPFFKELNRGQYIFRVVFTRVHSHSFFTLFRVKNLTFFSHFSLFRVDNSCFWVVFTLFRVNWHSLVFSLFLHLESTSHMDMIMSPVTLTRNWSIPTFDSWYFLVMMGNTYLIFTGGL